MKSVDAYIEGLPEDCASLCARIRSLILDTVPGVTEKISFGIPFYHYHGMFCYLNPVPGGIDVGFLRGRDLLELFPQLIQGKRKIVASITVANHTDISRVELREIIATAASWNEEAKREGKTFLTTKPNRKATSSGRKSAQGPR